MPIQFDFKRGRVVYVQPSRPKKKPSGPPTPEAGTAAARTTKVPVGWVLLQADDDDRLAVLVELGDRAPRPLSSGYGGWQAVARDLQTALTSWRGFDVYGVEMDLLIDNLDEGTSIEDVYDTIEALAGRGRRAPGGQPPVLTVDAAGVMPHDQHPSPTGDKDTRWVIATLEWSDDDDDNARNDAGNRILAACTVTLWKFEDGGRSLATQVAAVRKTVKQTKTKKTVKARAGDNLVTIARRELGDGGRWEEIAKLNGLRDPRHLKTGQKIRIP